MKFSIRNLKHNQTTSQISNFKFLIIFLLFCNFAFTQDYSFDFEEFEKKPYEYVGTFKMQSDLIRLNHSSDLYQLSFLNREEKDFFDSYFASVQLNGSYEISKFKLIADLKDKISYTTDNEFENNFSIYESFLNIDFSKNIDFQIGKKSVKWGKGYIWNPVSFVGRQKDINDVDIGLEGFWMLKFDYVKSITGFIQNFAITPVIVPVTESFNEDFQDEESYNFILNSYFLVQDTDIDFYLFMKENGLKKYGFDFARNILPSWEIHAEYVFTKEVNTDWLNPSFAIESTIDETNDYLFGTRFLFETNTTLIVEYLHNGAGLGEEQMNNFFDAIEYTVSGNDSLLPVIKQYQSESFSSQFLMKDYIYAKLSQPEPFDILYFTPSIFVLYNLNDNSQMIGCELSYSRFNNLNLKLKYNLMLGKENSEFGEKITSNKISFLMEYVF
ncbi:MAG: hypothetical protein U9N76_05045 [Candidatus Marinimicrobia bacterium]|nr:hypothetical protein [Candidatus Neomarinimicrobiota bacterium]